MFQMCRQMLKDSLRIERSMRFLKYQGIPLVNKVKSNQMNNGWEQKCKS